MEQKDYRLAAIMYTDIAGFSRMMERDETGTLDLLAYHNELIGEIVRRHHGTIIKTIGDALLVDFKNTVEALQSALEIQDKLYAHNKEHPSLPLLVRIGVHLGDIYFFENDALGEGINIAARLQSLAKPGCICFSHDVYNLVLNKIEFRAEKLGKVSLKNITKEIHAYEITSPNVEFDLERDKPRPGYKPGSYLDGADGEAAGGPGDGPGLSTAKVMADSAAPASSRLPRPAATPPVPPVPPQAGPDRSYSEEGSRRVLADIRSSILQDTKAMGRRMTVDEALSRYGYYGVEAREVIAALTEQGILARAGHAPGPPGPPVAGALFGQKGNLESIGRNLEAAVSGIVGEIERKVQQGMAQGQGSGSDYAQRFGRHAERFQRRMDRHAVKESIRRQATGMETGRWDSKLAEDDTWKPGSEELATAFDQYRSGLEIRCRRQRGGFIGNLTSFLAVNGLLWFINLTSSPGFLWAAIVSAAWGSGVLSSAVAAFRATTKLRELESLPPLEGRQLEDYKKLNRVKDSLALHGASAVGVPVLLGVINFLTGPDFLWFLIPTAALVFSFLSHLFAYSLTKPRLEKGLLASLGVAGGWKNLFRTSKDRKAQAAGLGPYAELYREAERAKRAVEEQLASGPGSVDADLAPSLDGYLGQVRLLAQSANEIDRIVEAIPVAELARDKAALLAKRLGAGSESLRGEYDSSIAEIEKQEKAYGELREQSEVISLRLGSSVNQLKQMRLDIARLKAAPGADGSGDSMDQLRRRTDEMARYLEDLRRGYDEGKKDPFAELEEAERRARLEGPPAQGS